MTVSPILEQMIKNNAALEKRAAAIKNVKKNSSPDAKPENKPLDSLNAFLVSRVPYFAIIGAGDICAFAGTQYHASKLSTDDKNIINKAVNETLKKPGIKEYDIKIVHSDILDNFSSKNKIVDKGIQFARYQIQKGYNACYCHKGFKAFGGEIKERSVILNRNKIPSAAFHELGHAINGNSDFLNAVKKSRIPIALIRPALFLFGILTTNSKTDSENETLTPVQKIKNFIRNHIGTFTFATVLPKLIEEAAASINGGELAKESISDKKILKNINKSNLAAFISYFGAAVAVSVGARSAVKLKDKYADRNRS